MAADSCPFERAVQTVHFECSQSQKTYIGEKEGIVCTHPNSRLRCIELVSGLKRNARFALKLAKNNTVLTHGQEMKLKCGGLQAIQQLLSKPATENNIVALIQDVLSEFDSIDKLPFPQIMRVVSEYRLRR